MAFPLSTDKEDLKYLAENVFRDSCYKTSVEYHPDVEHYTVRISRRELEDSRSTILPRLESAKKALEHRARETAQEERIKQSQNYSQIIKEMAFRDRIILDAKKLNFPPLYISSSACMANQVVEPGAVMRMQSITGSAGGGTTTIQAGSGVGFARKDSMDAIMLLMKQGSAYPDAQYIIPEKVGRELMKRLDKPEKPHERPAFPQPEDIAPPEPHPYRDLTAVPFGGNSSPWEK